MRKIYVLVIAALILFSNNGFAQCLTAGNGQWPTATFVPSCTGSPETITTAGFAGEYSVVTVTNGITYTFSSSIATDYITIGNSTGTIAYAFGTTPVTWTATFSGDIRFYTHISSACGENTTSRTRAIQCSLPVCATPGNQPTGLVLTPATGSMAGSFTAAAGGASNYLVIRTSTPAAPTAPADGTTYAPGSSALGGVIVSNGTTTTFNATGLSPSTLYYFWVYSFNNSGCTSGPKYRTVSPLAGSQSTLACSGPSGTISVGPTGTYPSLTAAIAAISGGIASSVIFELQATYVSSVETFPIVFPNNGCVGPTQTITIRPETGATGLSITSANTTATVNLNGCSYVTFDGRPGGVGAVSQLTIANTATAGVAMRFINDANNNTVKYCTVAGVTTSTTSGVILFSTTTGVNGNDNNTIDNCNITSGGTTATNTIYSAGTTTTAATNNSNNTISNNNIFNYFAAGSASAGIKLEGGNTDWTISNNKFYQTATRTHTSGVQHSAIWLNNSTSGNNFQVTGNTIGFASNTGTGTYTLVTLSGTTFIPIFASVGTTTASSIQGNTITAIAMSGASSGTSSSAPFRGIYVSSGLAYVGATSAGTSGTGNTIGSQSATGAITYTTTSTSASDVMGMFNFGSSNWFVMNNNIGGITASNSSTGAANVFGIRFNTSSAAATTVQNNTVGGTVANSLQSTSTATGSQVVGIYISTSNTAVSGNTIRNLSAAGGTGTATGASVIGINFISTSVNHTISQNTIFNLSNSNAAAATVVTGIQFTASTGPNVVEKNNIYGLSSATTSATAEINGIRVASGTTTYRNNMIAVGAAVGNAIIVNGVNEVGGIDNFWHNSIYVGGTATAGAANSFAFNSTVTTNVRSFRNNIFMNARSNSGATGKNYAVQVGGTAANPAGLTINNNVYYVTGAGTIFGRFNALDVADLAAWKTAVGQDATSAQADPQYNNPTAATPDLHLHPTNPTPAEGNGFDLGVADDFDGQARAGLTPVDIGADAGNFVTLDIFAPSISYTLLSNTLCATNRTLSATITDLSGVNITPGTKPRIYFKKSTNANTLGATNDNTTDGWKYAEASNAASPFSFTIDYALVNGGVAAGNTIQYFVVAQDLATTPNVGINSGSFAVNPASVALTAAAFPLAGTINSYNIGSGGIAGGTVTIGAAGTYPSLTGAGGLFAAINAGGLNGNLIANIIDASVTETGANALNDINYGCGGPFTLLVRPNAGLAATLTGTNANALIKLNGADNVTFDGLNTGGASLTIINTNAAGLTVMWIASSSAVDGANNNTIKNCTISGISSSGSVGCIIAGSGTTLGNAADAPNSNNTIQGNTLTTAQNGIYISGNLATFDQNWVINGNTIGSAVVANKMGFRGLSVQGVNNFTISNNTILGVVTATTATATGITTFVTATNGNIFGNKISDIKNTNASGFGANGISLQGTSTVSNINVYNNYISDVAGFGFNGTGVADNGYGLIVTAGGGYNIYYNTIVMNTNQTSATGLPAALNVTSGVTAANSLNVRDNIFVNTQTVGTERYCVFSGAAASVYADINYNDYYFTGPDLGNIGGTLRANLAAWQTGTGKDAQSKSVQPIFVSGTDFHLSNAAGANWCLNGTGQAIATFTTDYDGDSRGTPPDMGADEFTAVGTGDIATPASQTVCTATPITTIVLSGGAASYSWTRDNTVAATGIAASGTGNISGTLTNTTTSPVTVTFTITALNAANCAAPATFTATVTVNPNNTITLTSAPGTNAQTVCINTPITNITYATTAATGATFSGLPAGVTGSWAANVVTISGTPTTTVGSPFNYTVTLTGGGPCGTLTANGTITVTPDNTISLTSAPGTDAQSICLNSSITNITYSTTGATGATFSGLPAGVTGSWAANVVTISGTPTTTVGSPFNYTVTLTGGCGNITAGGSITVRPLPVIGSSQVEPTTCVSADGSITLTLSGAAGPYTFAWTGSGVNPTSQNQTGLTVGAYAVTVTAANGCTATANFALAGPGGCSICPTIPTFATNPAGAACAGSNVTFTASGLTNMGITYGIIFKYSASPLANPYVGGTVIATVANGALTSGGTVATANSAAIPAGNYTIYAILTPTPIDPVCRPAGQTALTIGATPDVNQPANQTVCNNTATAAVNFTGSIPGAVFNWTNNTTSIGLAASGTGNIASFTATNATNAAVTATITVTPQIVTPVPVNQVFTYTGAMQTFTVPAGVTSVNIQAFGAQGGSGAVGGNTAAGGNGGLGASATGTLAVTPGDVLNIFVGGQGATPTGGFNGGGNGGNQNAGGGGGASDVRAGGTGIANRVITAGGGGGGGRGGCDEGAATTGGVGGNGGNGGGGVGANGANSPTSGGVAGGGFGGNAGSVQGAFGAAGIGCGGFLGAPGIATANEIGGDGGNGQTCCCFSFGSIPGGGGGGGGQLGGGGAGGGSAGTTGCSGNSKGAGGGGGGGASYIGGVTTGSTASGVQSGNGQVIITYSVSPITCSGTPKTFTITVNPTPVVNAVTSQTVCNGALTAPVNFTSPTTGPTGAVTFNWTNSNTAIGLGASGTGNIPAFTGTNATVAPISGTITVTPVYTGGSVTCTGTPITFTITVNPIPTVNAQANQTVCSGSTATATFTGAVAGTVYNWTNSNTAIGLGASGTGNISFIATNPGVTPIVGTITVTPTYTNGGTTCSGTPISFTITVNPLPTVNAIPNQVVCQNAPTAPVNFTGTPAGVVFQWTNNTPAIGLAAAGTGNIPSFIAQNPGTTPLVATITVTPVTGLSSPVTTTFAYTGAVQTYTVPAGITSVSIKTWGAQGNSNALAAAVGGLGGYAEGNLAVTPGQVLNVYVGGGAATSITGGFNGGGNAGVNAGCASAQGGGGGGASDVRIAPYALANRVIVGAGGGGAGANRVAGCGRGTGGGGGGGYYGGGGGAGWPGIPGSEGPVPTGGTQAAGGAGGITTFTPGPTNGFPGALGVGGAGGTEIGSNQGGSATAEPGGIGGGTTGGSGLYNNVNNWCGQSGAGGSSYIGGVTGGLTTPGLRSGNGQVQITYTPASATTCFGTARTFTITVNPNANLIIVADPGTTLCEGDPTLLTVYDAGSVSAPGTLYTQGTTVVNGSPSQVFEPANVAFNSQAADDFVVPAGGNWGVTGITANGIGTGAPTSVNVFFYTNSGTNLPGTTIASFTNLTTFTRVGGNYTVTLPSSVALTAGRYWMSFQVNMSFAAGGQWFWGNYGAPIVGNQYAWQNPGGGFATPCTSWGYGGTGCNVGGGAANVNNIFSIVGTNTGLGPQSTGTFLWSPAAGLSSTTSNPVAASPQNTTTYTVTRTTVPGGCQASAQVTITVNKRPVVTTQPVSRVNCSGTTATFTVGGTGTGLTYQWQMNTAGCTGGTWVNVPTLPPYAGGTTPTLTITPVDGTMSGYGFRCVLSGICAPWTPPTNVSNCATLTVNPLPNLVVTPPVSCGGVAGISGTALTVTQLPPPVPGTVTVNSGAIAVAIPDGSNVAATTNLTVAGIPAAATITDAKVNVNISHTWVGDVDLNLRAPNNAILNLVAGLNGGTGGNAGDNFTNTTFSSLSSAVISGAPDPRTGTFAAEARAGRGPIGFIQTVATWGALYPTATAANGVWTLAAGDRVLTDVGTITNWSITINYTTPGSGPLPTLSYVWTPNTTVAAGLYTNNTATTLYTGTNLSTVYAAPPAQTTYTVTATNTATGCVGTATALVNYTPPAPTVTPSSVTMCLGDPAVKLKSSSSTTSTVAFNSGTIAVAIPDNNQAGASHTIAVSGIPANATVTGMRVKMTIPHTFIGDLVIALRAPNNNVLNLDFFLSNTFGGVTTGFSNTIFTSAAGAPAVSTGTNPYSASFRADGQIAATGNGPAAPTGYTANMASYAALIGSLTPANVNGNYTLAMYDGGAIDIGTLTNWEIEFTYVVGVPASPAVWSPAAGLFSDALATVPYVAGTAVDSVWARPTPQGVYPYQVTVNNLITTLATPTTPMAGGNGNNLVTFNVKNNNTYPVTLSSISSNTFGSGAVTSTVFYKTTGNAGNPGPISAANGFVQFGSAASTVTAGAMNQLVSGLNLQIPAGATYAIAIDMTGATFPAYTNGAATTVTYSDAGCDIITGGNVGWGGPNAPAAPVNNPRNFNGSITFLGSGPGSCTSPPRTVVVTVNQPTTLNSNLPANQTVCTDKVATFSVAVTAGTGPHSYQWQVSTNSGNPPWTNVTNTGVYSGATTATLTITAPPVSMSGYQYRCIVTGAAPCAAATSKNAILTVNPLPVIVISAAPYTSLFPGLRTTLSSTVSPNAASTYSWIRNGVVLASPAQGVLSGLGTGTIQVDVDGMGDYQLRVTDVNGCTNTSNTLTIKDSASGRCFIYPNPNSGQFQVRYYSVANNVLPRGIVVYNALGDRVLVQNYTIGRPYDRMDVDMRRFGKGIYAVEIVDRNGNRITVCRVVIE